MADFGNHRFGGKESVNALMARVAAAWDAWRGSGQDAVWITHAGVVRAVSLLVQGQRTVERSSSGPASRCRLGSGWRWRSEQPTSDKVLRTELARCAGCGLSRNVSGFQEASVFGSKSQYCAKPHCQHSGLRAWQM